MEKKLGRQMVDMKKKQAQAFFLRVSGRFPDNYNYHFAPTSTRLANDE